MAEELELLPAGAIAKAVQGFLPIIRAMQQSTEVVKIALLALHFRTEKRMVGYALGVRHIIGLDVHHPGDIAIDGISHVSSREHGPFKIILTLRRERQQRV